MQRHQRKLRRLNGEHVKSLVFAARLHLIKRIESMETMRDPALNFPAQSMAPARV